MCYSLRESLLSSSQARSEEASRRITRGTSLISALEHSDVLCTYSLGLFFFPAVLRYCCSQATDPLHDALRDDLLEHLQAEDLVFARALCAAVPQSAAREVAQTLLHWLNGVRPQTVLPLVLAAVTDEVAATRAWACCSSCFFLPSVGVGLRSLVVTV